MPLDEAITLFNYTFLKILNDLPQIRTRNVKSNTVSWLTKEMKHLVLQRDKAWKDWYKNKAQHAYPNLDISETDKNLTRNHTTVISKK